jgi:outer membrane protein TolC
MKKIVLSLAVPLVMYAHTMSELFDALKNHSQTKSDEMAVKKSGIYKDMADSKLYPKVNLFVKYDNYSTPTGMVPVPPNSLLEMVGANKDTSKQPFSYNVFREGAAFSMPLFVKSIFTTAEKAEAMQKSAKAKKRINLLKNEALIVGANANYLYLDALDKALQGKEKSLLETQKTLQIKVDNGRAPKSALYKLNDGLNQIAIAKNNIALQRKEIISSVESLTGIALTAPVPMQEVQGVVSGGFASLQPLREKIRADRLAIRAEKEKLYPSLFAQGSYVFSQGTAYNSKKDVSEEYGNIGVTLNIPILEMDQYDSVALSKVEVHSSEVELQKQEDELRAKAKMLESSLPLLDNSLKLYKRSVEDKQKLLEIAKVNYKNGRLSTEEYLRYEDDVVAAEANLYKTKATKWQTVMQLAVIYANDIEEMVK